MAPDKQALSHYPSWPLPVALPLVNTEPHPCNYLPNREASFGAIRARRIAPAVYQQLMDAGFRRSGTILYQPHCVGCRECRPIRVPVGRFVPSRSQRRVQRRNADISVRVASPMPTQEKLELYNIYQSDRHDGTQAADEEAFVTFLYRSPTDTLEFEYRDRNGKLIGVGICDLCPASLSSVYFFFDPAESRRSLGTFSALYEIEWCRGQHLNYWYAGYWISGAPTMAYKSRFRPCEILGTDSVWRELPFKI
jgi:leucyl-tRNA---protein transferase